MSEENIEDNEQQLMEALSQQMELLDYSTKSGEPLKAGQEKASREQLIDALKTVSDPEIPINIWDMGLIYDLDQKDNGDVSINMTLTAPTCPVAGILPGQAAEAVAAVKGVGEVEVKLVWEPAWSFERLSEDAKMMLEMF